MKLKEGKLYKVLNNETKQWTTMKYVAYHWMYGEVFVSPTNKNKYLFVDELEIDNEVKKIKK